MNGLKGTKGIKDEAPETMKIELQRAELRIPEGLKSPDKIKIPQPELSDMKR